MLTHRPAAERGIGRFDWLDSRHSFSFGDYHDPRFYGHGPLLVINEDRIAPGGGFPMHGHRDMEIITVVLDGALAHQDSLGNGSEIRPDKVQRMSAGTGIRHSEFNASQSEPVHLLQIWLLPDTAELKPGYEEVTIATAADGWQHIGGPNAEAGTVTIHQDADLFLAQPRSGEALTHRIEGERLGWLQVAKGRVTLDGLGELSAGDGVAIAGAEDLALTAQADSTLLLFDMTGAVGRPLGH